MHFWLKRLQCCQFTDSLILKHFFWRQTTIWRFLLRGRHKLRFLRHSFDFIRHLLLHIVETLRHFFGCLRILVPADPNFLIILIVQKSCNFFLLHRCHAYIISLFWMRFTSKNLCHFIRVLNYPVHNVLLWYFRINFAKYSLTLYVIQAIPFRLVRGDIFIEIFFITVATLNLRLMLYEGRLWVRR